MWYSNVLIKPVNHRPPTPVAAPPKTPATPVTVDAPPEPGMAPRATERTSSPLVTPDSAEKIAGDIAKLCSGYTPPSEERAIGAKFLRFVEGDPRRFATLMAALQRQGVDYGRLVEEIEDGDARARFLSATLPFASVEQRASAVRALDGGLFVFADDAAAIAQIVRDTDVASLVTRVDFEVVLDALPANEREAFVLRAADVLSLDEKVRAVAQLCRGYTPADKERFIEMFVAKVPPDQRRRFASLPDEIGDRLARFSELFGDLAGFDSLRARTALLPHAAALDAVEAFPERVATQGVDAAYVAGLRAELLAAKSGAEASLAQMATALAKAERLSADPQPLVREDAARVVAFLLPQIEALTVARAHLDARIAELAAFERAAAPVLTAITESQARVDAALATGELAPLVAAAEALSAAEASLDASFLRTTRLGAAFDVQREALVKRTRELADTYLRAEVAKRAQAEVKLQRFTTEALVFSRLLVDGTDAAIEDALRRSSERLRHIDAAIREAKADLRALRGAKEPFARTSADLALAGVLPDHIPLADKIATLEAARAELVSMQQVAAERRALLREALNERLSVMGLPLVEGTDDASLWAGMRALGDTLDVPVPAPGETFLATADAVTGFCGVVNARQLAMVQFSDALLLDNFGVKTPPFDIHRLRANADKLVQLAGDFPRADARDYRQLSAAVTMAPGDPMPTTVGVVATLVELAERRKGGQVVRGRDLQELAAYAKSHQPLDLEALQQDTRVDLGVREAARVVLQNRWETDKLDRLAEFASWHGPEMGLRGFYEGLLGDVDRLQRALNREHSDGRVLADVRALLVNLTRDQRAHLVESFDKKYGEDAFSEMLTNACDGYERGVVIALLTSDTLVNETKKLQRLLRDVGEVREGETFPDLPAFAGYAGKPVTKDAIADLTFKLQLDGAQADFDFVMHGQSAYLGATPPAEDVARARALFAEARAAWAVVVVTRQGGDEAATQRAIENAARALARVRSLTGEFNRGAQESRHKTAETARTVRDFAKSITIVAFSTAATLATLGAAAPSAAGWVGAVGVGTGTGTATAASLSATTQLMEKGRVDGAQLLADTRSGAGLAFATALSCGANFTAMARLTVAAQNGSRVAAFIERSTMARSFVSGASSAAGNSMGTLIDAIVYRAAGDSAKATALIDNMSADVARTMIGALVIGPVMAKLEGKGGVAGAIAKDTAEAVLTNVITGKPVVDGLADTLIFASAGGSSRVRLDGEVRVDTKKSLVPKGDVASTADVFVGRHADRDVAVKVYKEKRYEAFELEAESMARAAELGVAPRVLGVFEHNGRPAFAMELVDGVSPERAPQAITDVTMRDYAAKINALAREGLFPNRDAQILVRPDGSVAFIDINALHPRPGFETLTLDVELPRLYAMRTGVLVDVSKPLPPAVKAWMAANRGGHVARTKAGDYVCIRATVGSDGFTFERTRIDGRGRSEALPVESFDRSGVRAETRVAAGLRAMRPSDEPMLAAATAEERAVLLGLIAARAERRDAPALPRGKDPTPDAPKQLPTHVVRHPDGRLEARFDVPEGTVEVPLVVRPRPDFVFSREGVGYDYGSADGRRLVYSPDTKTWELSNRYHAIGVDVPQAHRDAATAPGPEGEKLRAFLQADNGFVLSADAQSLVLQVFARRRSFADVETLVTRMRVLLEAPTADAREVLQNASALGLVQYARNSCVPTTGQMLAAETSPLYALELVARGRQDVAAEQARVLGSAVPRDAAETTAAIGSPSSVVDRPVIVERGRSSEGMLADEGVTAIMQAVEPGVRFLSVEDRPEALVARLWIEAQKGPVPIGVQLPGVNHAMLVVRAFVRADGSQWFVVRDPDTPTMRVISARSFAEDGQAGGIISLLVRAP